MQAEIAERTAVQDNLRDQTQEVSDTINVLVAAAGEILATTTQLASGAAETATAGALTAS